MVLSGCVKEDTDSVRLQGEGNLDEDFNISSSGVSGPTASGDIYTEFEENPFINVSEQAVSTFSIDADGASYSNVRRYVMDEDQLPPKAAVRTEELINYFDLDYDFPSSTDPIALNGEVSDCPWNVEHKLMRIGIKGKPLENADDTKSNFVLLIDVSGSMSSVDKLELLKEGFIYFVDQMEDEDRIAIVTYAGEAGLVLESTPGTNKEAIKDAINSLGSGGSTAGAEGIITAYEIAEEHFINGGNNRVILGTDGDFNVGISNQEELVALIEEKRELGIFLTVLGVGRGNLNDAMLEQIADNGNGTYEYVDNLLQLKKIFVYGFSKFYTIAKDVKVQVEFNPQQVLAYRLIGYENKLLSEEDFEDDGVDAGEIGADQNITALYELKPANVNNLYTPSFTIDFRYKEPDTDTSIPLSLDVFDEGASFNESSEHMQFVSSVAAFSMLLTDSEYKGTSTYDDVLNWLYSLDISDNYGFKSEFKELVQKASDL